MEDTLTLVLKKPVDHGGQTYEKLELREPTAGELAEADGLSGTVLDIKLVSIVAAIPEGAAKKLGARDIIAAATFLGGFLTPAPTTGEAP